MEKDIKQNIETVFGFMQKAIEKMYNRWQDEKEMEDFKEYEKVLSQVFDCYTIHSMRGASFIKAMKRPFGIAFRYESWYVEFLVTSTAYKWRAKIKW